MIESPYLDAIMQNYKISLFSFVQERTLKFCAGWYKHKTLHQNENNNKTEMKTKLNETKSVLDKF